MSLQVTPSPTPFPSSSPHTFADVPALLGFPGIFGTPDLIREAAGLLESYSPDIDADLSEITFTDYGNLLMAEADDVEKKARQVGDACRAIIGTGAKPLFLACDALFTPSAIRATADRYPELAVIQMGARGNLLDDFEGHHWHARTSMQRTLDRLPPTLLKQLGIRSGNKKEFAQMRASETLISAEDLPSLGEKGLYLSLDLSLFDPCTMPGVFNPEPGGINWEEFSEIIALIPWKQVKACDLVGLEPSLDTTGLSTLLAAKVAREMILSLAKASS